MTFFADFHVHSRYSRATAKQLDLEHLYISAQIKGITVVGTGDFTHPAWFAELVSKLVPAEEGLYRLKDDIAQCLDERVPVACRQPVRFMLVTEISNIYKKSEKTRKNHNLVFLPDLSTVAEFNRRLAKIGNIESDGRPIIGLDSRNLLEMVLETSPSGFIIPAHIWTPWFSLLGSKSGFDTVEECFEDLTDHIFALETGLSSDPAMNWRISNLDDYALVSNSDAHSPSKLGREANIFNTTLSYPHIVQSLKSAESDRFLGTIEFYPEEGKYHLDGHRKCNYRCSPSQTHQLDGKCPVCGKPLTLGVLYRVEALSDRKEGVRPPKARPFHSLIPLENILAEVLQVGEKSKKVELAYNKAIDRLGSEFNILLNHSKDILNTVGIPLLSDAIERMRDHQVVFEAGYDGEFGRVRIFNQDEREQLLGQLGIFQIPAAGAKQKKDVFDHPSPKTKPTVLALKNQQKPSESLMLNSAQQAVVDHGDGHILISAGPGTGKTRTITSRIITLIQDRDIPSENILAVTYTHKAAEEMLLRLRSAIEPGVPLPWVTTFHGFCWRLILDEAPDAPSAIVPDLARSMFIQDAIHQIDPVKIDDAPTADLVLDYIVKAKQSMLGPEDDLSSVIPADHHNYVSAIYKAYQSILSFQCLYDYEDLIFHVVRKLDHDVSWRLRLQKQFRYIFIDEFQDINESQYRLMTALLDPQSNLCAIGDPNQAIYGFRGSDWRFFNKISEDFPNVRHIQLGRNYRSTATIVEASQQVIRFQETHPETQFPSLVSSIEGIKTISFLTAASARAEAVAIGKAIESKVGGIGFHSMDFGHSVDQINGERSFADFAILYRNNQQGEILAEILTRAGIPCQLTNKNVFQGVPLVAKITAVLRLMANEASYADAHFLLDMVSPAVPMGTLKAFKKWAYQQRITLREGMNIIAKFPVPGLTAAAQHRLVALVQLLEQLRQETEQLNIAERIQMIIARSPHAFPGDEAMLQQLLDRARHFDRDLTGFLTGFAILSDTDLYSNRAEKVALLTMHAAKGLEFPVVFIAGCEDGLIPFRGNDHGNADMDVDEERRLFYVAMTRAREELILSWARKRSIYGKTMQRSPSPFLSQIESIRAEHQPTGTTTQHQLSLF